MCVTVSYWYCGLYDTKSCQMNVQALMFNFFHSKKPKKFLGIGIGWLLESADTNSVIPCLYNNIVFMHVF